MSVGQHEAVSVGPMRIGWVVFEVFAPECNCDIRHAHGRAGMTGICKLYRVHCQCTNRTGHLLVVRHERLRKRGVNRGTYYFNQTGWWRLCDPQQRF